MSPEDRREAILDAAQALFMARGWEAVTIADVLKSAGISKGGFYHHFNAKEDLLTGIISRLTSKALEATEALRSGASGNALQRLNAFLDGSARWTADNVKELRGFADIWAQPSNAVLLNRIQDAQASAVMQPLIQMICDGIEEGIFDTKRPDLVAEVMLSFSQGRQKVLGAALKAVAHGDLDAATDALVTRMLAEGAAMDRLLGLPEGSVQLSSPKEFRRMLVGMKPAQPESVDLQSVAQDEPTTKAVAVDRRQLHAAHHD